MKKMACSAPVLFLVFNRPEVTRGVFEAIRKARPKRLYIAADGPRQKDCDDKRKTQEVRKIVSAVDWPCRVQTLFRNKNLGCRMAISSAINWFFQNEEEGIILEDDCLPSPDFFLFCEQLLEKYRHEERVMMIAGSSFLGDKRKLAHSYFFTKYFFMWGWASWRRAWKHYDIKMRLWPEVRDSGAFLKIMNKKGYVRSFGEREFAFWRRWFDYFYTDTTTPWEYQWLFACWMRHALAIVPAVNLISNIGFGEEALHTRGEITGLSDKKFGKLRFPLNHPRFFFQEKKADELMLKASINLLYGIWRQEDYKCKAKRALLSR